MKLFTTLSLFLLPLAFAHFCPIYTTNTTSHITASPPTLRSHITSFLSALGSENTGTGTFSSGFRHLNWDDEQPFSTNGNFSEHGIILQSKESKIFHSNAPDTDDDRFSSVIRRSLSRTLKRFSHPRLIVPAKSNKLRATFRLPGTDTRGAVSAFGAVFIDVDETRRTWLWLKDSDGCTIARVEVPVMNGGLSFVGVVVGDGRRPVVAEVMIKLGSATVADFRNGDPCVDFVGDLVVLDDVFFAEPKPLVENRS